MKRFLRKTACAALAGVVIFSMTGCSLSTKEQQETTTEDDEEEEIKRNVMEAAEEYCAAIAAAEGEKIVELSTPDLMTIAEYLEFLDFETHESYSPDTAALLRAIADTIVYEFDEDSYVISRNGRSASVDVEFTFFDYSRDVDNFEEYSELDAYLAFIPEGPTKTVTETIEFELSPDGWLVTNTDMVTDQVYEFLILGVLPGPDYIYGEDERQNNIVVVDDADIPLLNYLDQYYSVIGSNYDVDYQPDYYARLIYEDNYEVTFSGVSLSGVSDFDYDTHTGTVDSSSEDSFYIGNSYTVTYITQTNTAFEPGLGGFLYYIDHDGVISVADASELNLTIGGDDFGPGNYTITLVDTWDRILWECYIEVV